jgi:biopolymer transport protein ExbB
MNNLILQIPILLQGAAETTSSGGNSESGIVETSKDYTLWEMLASGGWYIMIPMAILSILMVYVGIERYLAITKAQKGETSFMVKVREYIHEGKLDAAKNLCSTTDSPIARMIEKGISKIGKPMDDIKASIENIGKVEVYRLEKGVTMLATIAGVAPMIGFLGTVIGMVQTFQSLRVNGMEIGPLSEGMMMAMITTVVGLVIGIFAFMLYNMFVTKINNVIHKMESSSIEFLDLLDEPGK